MQSAQTIVRMVTPPDWKSRDVLTLTEAAAVAGRSYTWARNRLTDGSLETRGCDASGVAVVSVKSVAVLLTELARPKSRGRHAHLQLVVSR